MSEPRGWHSRGYLPHRDEPGLIQAVTYRLADSLPADCRDRAVMHAELDRCLGSCALRDPRIASLVETALLAGDGERYHLLAWVVMPNHVHVLVEVLPLYALGAVVRSWKGPVARQANVLLGTPGRFWQPEYHDRYIRDAEHVRNAVLYVHNNPVMAGLVPEPQLWPYSSAYRLGNAEAAWHDTELWL